MTDDAGRELARYQKWNVVVLAAAIALARWNYGPRAGFSLALGGILGAINFWLTAAVIRLTFTPDLRPGAGGVAMVVLKFLAFFGGVGAALLMLRPDSIPFGIGFCTILVVIVLFAIIDLAKGDDAS